MNSSEIKSIIKDLLKYKDLSETRWITLKKEDKKIWALVLAWQDDFEKVENPNEYQFGEYRICGKIAYNDSYMKEYDIDWIMPYDETTGEVDNTECSIDNEDEIGSAIAFWEKCWQNINH